MKMRLFFVITMMGMLSLNTTMAVEVVQYEQPGERVYEAVPTTSVQVDVHDPMTTYATPPRVVAPQPRRWQSAPPSTIEHKPAPGNYRGGGMVSKADADFFSTYHGNDPENHRQAVEVAKLALADDGLQAKIRSRQLRDEQYALNQEVKRGIARDRMDERMKDGKVDRFGDTLKATGRAAKDAVRVFQSLD